MCEAYMPLMITLFLSQVVNRNLDRAQALADDVVASGGVCTAMDAAAFANFSDEQRNGGVLMNTTPVSTLIVILK